MRRIARRRITISEYTANAPRVEQHRKRALWSAMIISRWRPDDTRADLPKNILLRAFHQLNRDAFYVVQLFANRTAP